MSRKRIQDEANTLIAELPPFPAPWDIGELCRLLARRRGKPLEIHSLNLPALPFGLWHSNGRADYIVYRGGITGYHRDHTILHEICHMLAGHNLRAAPGEQADDVDVSELLQQAMRNRRSNYEEELAETFASTALRLASRSPVAPSSAFEQRAAAMFGAA